MDLVNYVPDFVNQSPTFSVLYEEEQSEVDIVNANALDLQNQCFVDTATWGISDWEVFCGIPINTNNDINYRRSNVLAKIRSRGTSTDALVQSVASSYENGAVQVIEHATTSTIEIKFISYYGIPPNLTDLENSLSRIIPAHLAILYTYLYNTYSVLSNQTFNALSQLTYNQIPTHQF